MKKILFSAALVLSSISVLAQEVDTCFTFDVPPLMQIGNAPAQKTYLQVSENPVAGLTMLKILSPDTGTGISMYASMCRASRSDISCTEPFMGTGTVQLIKSQGTISLNKVNLKMEKSTIATKILGTKSNLKLSQINCSEFIKIMQ